MRSAQDILEFGRILGMLAGKCRTRRGALLAEGLSPYEDLHELRKELLRMRELSSLLPEKGSLPLRAGEDLRAFLGDLKKGREPSGRMLLYVLQDIEDGKAARAYLGEGDSPLKELSLQLPGNERLREELSRALEEDGSLKDQASGRLLSIRRSMKALEKGLRREAERLLMENISHLSSPNLTLRNGHYVLSVLPSDKNKVRGLVQGVSRTGGTVYIEPEPLLLMESRIEELREEEKEEERKILRHLGDMVLEDLMGALERNRTLGRLDLLEAKCRLMGEWEGSIPEIGEGKELLLPKARHPLLDQATVVPNDFILREGRRLLLLSGPNAGGKTVALKTVGLLSLMALSGMGIPAGEGARVPFFRHVYADIGDSQSLQESLSTFSGHMKAVGEILSSLEGEDLVLLDELGSGTSPEEGEALGEGILQMILAKGALALVSSHYEGLKGFALRAPGAENCSLAFDEGNLRPTYRLRAGIPGESYGILVAERFGLPEEATSRARAILQGKEAPSLEEALRTLRKKSEEAEREKERLQAERSALEEERKAFLSKKKALERKEEELREKLALGERKLLSEYERRLKDILKGVEGKGLPAGAKALHEIRSLGEEERKEEPRDDSRPLGPGDYVEAPSLFLEGEILSIQGTKATIGERNGRSMKVPLSALRRKERPLSKKKPREEEPLPTYEISPAPPMELNLIGMRAEEAEEAFLSYLDSAIAHGLTHVRIVHGFGSGVLRNMVRGYLSRRKDVVLSYGDGSPQEGGGGATVVELRGRKA